MQPKTMVYIACKVLAATLKQDMAQKTPKVTKKTKYALKLLSKVIKYLKRYIFEYC